LCFSVDKKEKRKKKVGEGYQKEAGAHSAKRSVHTTKTENFIKPEQTFVKPEQWW
jgi:hypothetical protein